MGKLIRINKQINRPIASTKKLGDSSMKEASQIIMFTGVRYERHLEIDENIDNKTSLSKKNSRRAKNNSKLG